LIDSTLDIFLTNATSINDKGQIVAQGTDVDGNFVTYLLSQAKK
jgi:hypothetical protein